MFEGVIEKVVEELKSSLDELKRDLSPEDKIELNQITDKMFKTLNDESISSTEKISIINKINAEVLHSARTKSKV